MKLWLSITTAKEGLENGDPTPTTNACVVLYTRMILLSRTGKTGKAGWPDR